VTEQIGGTVERTRAAAPAPSPGDAPATAAPDHPIRIARRAALLVCAAIGCTILLAVVATVVLSNPSRNLATLHRREVPAIRALQHASREGRRAQAAFVAALDASGAERNALAADAQQAGAASSEYIARFRRLGDLTPAERELLAQYEELTRASQAAGAAAFALVDSPDAEAREAARDEQARATAAAAERLDALSSRVVARLTAGVEHIDSDLENTERWLWATAGAIVVVFVLAGAALVIDGRRKERVLRALDRERQIEERRASLETQLQRGLEMEPTEEATYEVIDAALRVVRPGAPVEVLLADSSRAHFRQVISTDDEHHGPGCGVGSPPECPAASSGQTRVFVSSTRLDACPYLRARADTPVSALCVPISIAGKTTGVIHTTGPDSFVPDSDEVAAVELVARKAGERLGYLRVLSRTEMQAQVDPLTGLANRRTLENRARELMERADPFVVAFADLDHFKDLNDTFGHEVGDRALRLFGRVLRDAVRPGDTPARYGGEEFVVLLPDIVLADARTVAERIRERLRRAADGASVPPFTVSIGLAPWQPPEDFADTVARADAAMMRGKQLGRDRVVTTAEVPDDEATIAPPAIERAQSP